MLSIPEPSYDSFPICIQLYFCAYTKRGVTMGNLPALLTVFPTAGDRDGTTPCLPYNKTLSIHLPASEESVAHLKQ